MLELLVQNHPGVMVHVAGLFARRAFNLEGILCGPPRDTGLSSLGAAPFRSSVVLGALRRGLSAEPLGCGVSSSRALLRMLLDPTTIAPPDADYYSDPSLAAEIRAHY